jgi:hypothetical protein
MADLTGLQAAQSVKIAGANPSTGIEDNFMEVDSTGMIASKVADSANNLIGSDTGNPGIQYLRTSVVQSILPSTNNSSTANLASGASFTGTAEIALGQDDIEINFIADQKVTIQVQQSSNSTNWDIIDTYVVQANVGDARTFKSLALYWRIVVTNNGGSTTTFLRLQSALIPISNPLPRSLTPSGNLRVEEQGGSKNTYNASFTFTAAASPTDIFTITGSATKTIKVLKTGITAIQTTASFTQLIILKRSTANTVGTSTVVTSVANDSQDPAATATVLAYTANPTLGTLVGHLRDIKFLIPVPSPGGNASAQPEVIQNFDDIAGQPVILRGTSEVLSINMNGVTITGNSFSIWIKWTEE